MIKVIYGKKGTGKSRRLIAFANERHTSSGENAVFIDHDCDRMYLIDRGIRFINASEFPIDGPKMFSGFVSGIAAQDYDLQAVYINSFMKIVKHPITSLEKMFGFLEVFSDRMNVELIISISSDEPMPAFLEKYIL